MRHNNKNDGVLRTSQGAVKRKFSKKVWIAISCACGTLCIALILIFLNNNGGNSVVYDDIRVNAAPTQLTALVKTPVPAPTITPETQLTPAPDGIVTDDSIDNEFFIMPTDRDIDFKMLMEKNSDVIAWVTVPGTKIDYPVVKSGDNADYLEVDIDGSPNKAGAIFMDMGNNPNFTDRNTVLYGHNMKNGSMFAGLHEFEDSDFFDENRIIKIYTPGGEMREYEIAAAFLTSNNNVLYEYDFTDDKMFGEYLDKMLNNNDVDANVFDKDITVNDHILTLSTCERGEPEKRFVVVGVLKAGGVSNRDE